MYPDVTGIDPHRWQALGLLALATLSLAVVTILGKKFAAIPQETLATGMTLAATILITPLALLQEGEWHLSSSSLTSIAAVLFLAVFSTAAAAVLFLKTLDAGGTLAVGIADNLVLPIAVGLSALILHEPLNTRMGIATLLIVAGMLVTQGGGRRWVGKRVSGNG